MQRLLTALFLVPLLLIASACSEDDAPRSATPTAVVGLVRGEVRVDFTGAPQQRPNVSRPFAVEPGANAWTAVQMAVGRENVTYQDFGGSLGIFITGFHGVVAQGNDYWEFRVNGTSSNVGVSSYVVREGDVLEFRYSR